MPLTDQEKTTDEILEFLGRYAKSLKILVAALEEGNKTQWNFSLAALADADLGHNLVSALGLTESLCRERLIGPLKRIEADLNRAGVFAGQAASPLLMVCLPNGLMVVRSVLNHLQKAGDAIPPGNMASASATPAPNLLPEDRKRWWKFWK